MIQPHANFASIAAGVYQDYLSKPFHGKTWFNRLRIQTHLTCDGTKIYRPNHGLAHSIRVAHYIPYIWEYFKKNGVRNADGSDHYGFDKLTELEVQKIQIAALFYVVGREDETGFRHSATRYNSYRAASAEKFRDYCKCHDLIGDGKVFANISDMEQYATFLHQGEHGIIEAIKHNQKINPLRILLSTAHELDLSRCFPRKRYQAALVEEKLNYFSQYANNRDLHALMGYAQNCIIATGDVLSVAYQFDQHTTPGDQPQTAIRPLQRTLTPISWKTRFKWFSNFYSFFYPRYYNFKLFKQASTNAESCLQLLDSTPKPIFLSDSLAHVQPKLSEALQTIQAGDAVIRLMNTDPQSNQLRFELEQYADTKSFRPVYFQKRNDVSETDRNFLVDLKRSSKNERKGVTRALIDTAEPSSNETVYYSESGDLLSRPVSTENRRGQYKDTPYTKKASYSLLRQDGQIKHFSGNSPIDFFKHLFGISIKIGLLCDVKEMHRKGEKYLFAKDVGTTGPSGYFWLGRDRRQFSDALFPERFSPLTLEGLKEHINQKDPAQKSGPTLLPSVADNEMLIGGSAAALKGLFATKNTLAHRLRLLETKLCLIADYGLNLPMLIIDGKSAPQDYTQEQIQADLLYASACYQHSNLLQRMRTASSLKTFKRIAKQLKIELSNPKEVRQWLAAATRADSTSHDALHGVSSHATEYLKTLQIARTPSQNTGSPLECEMTMHLQSEPSLLKSGSLTPTS